MDQDSCSRTVHVIDRTTYSNREKGVVRLHPYEADSMAPEAALARTQNFGKGYSLAALSPSTTRLVVK